MAPRLAAPMEVAPEEGSHSRRTPPPTVFGQQTAHHLPRRRRCCRARTRACCFFWPLAGAAVLVFVHWRHDGIPANLPTWDYCSRPSAKLKLPSKSNGNSSQMQRWSEDMVKRMRFWEKKHFTRGVGYRVTGNRYEAMEGYYVGNVWAVPRLGLPSITMQDAMQGFRTSDKRTVDRVTSFPCALAVASTWSVNSTHAWAKAIGEEFRAKGANVMLGPSVNVHRVASNGRNAEYLSGEDPILGAELAAAYVRGMQDSAGVAAVVKHFLLNQQETERNTVDSIADERTRFEVYYRPFQAAIEAGVAAVMCSYNSVNGQQACQNDAILTRELKGWMGFKGWVMSDWWALKSSDGAVAGTDQDMPGNDEYYHLLPWKRQDAMVARILYGMASSGAWSYMPSCRVGCTCDRLLYRANATSEAHVQLARRLAAEGAVLLKNDRLRKHSGQHVLPLRQGQTVALVGRACAVEMNIEASIGDWQAASYYVIGGSGRVISSRKASIADGLQGRGLSLRIHPTDLLSAEMREDVKAADVVVACAGATSAEGRDRASLHLDQEQFLTDVLKLSSAADTPAVVVALVPGAFLAPWRHQAQAVLALFLSGQETGRAAGDVLMGDVVPSGKLPVTLPENAEDTIQPCDGRRACIYEEALSSGWHVYDDKEVAYPFGHGLSYTEFEYSAEHQWSERAAEDWALGVRIKNVGVVPGADVAQLYLGFPSDRYGSRPDMELRAFRKTRVLQPGEHEFIEFVLSPQHLAVWDTEQHNWTSTKSDFSAWVGASSRDLRLCGAFGRERRPRLMQPC